jgi:hypothetical protein
MSAPEAEGSQDYDDIMGFPGDGFQDKEDVFPPEDMDTDLDGGDTPMNEETSGYGHNSVKKARKVLRFLPTSLWWIVSRL